MRGAWLATMSAVVLSGCAGHLVVRPVTQPSDPGFRFYLPVPYLVVTNMALQQEPVTAATTTGAGASGTGASAGSLPAPIAGEALTSKIIWLPDMATPYAITARGGGGIGSFKESFQLANGWMLTGVNQESDAKVADTLSALAGLTGSAAAAAPLALAPGTVRPEQHAPFLLLFRIDTKANTLTPVQNEALVKSLEQALAAK